MFKLLVNTSIVDQEIIMVELSGGYYDESKVIFDERKDGTFPKAMLEHVGYLKREGSRLVIDEDMKEVYDVKMQEIADREYISKRAAEYPSMADQLDKIYHEGVDAWKAEIKAIKDKYPKPE